MTMIVVSVTAKDIADAITARENPLYIANNECPIAHALRRSGYSDAQVQRNNVTTGGKWYLTDCDTVDFIDSFDAGERVFPGEFVLKGDGA